MSAMPLYGMDLTIGLCSDFLTEIGVSVRTNVLSKEVEVSGKLDGYSEAAAPNTLPIILADILRQNGVKHVSTTKVREMLSCIADANRYNPVRQYLNALQWDRADRLPGLYAMLGAEKPAYKVYIRKWLIQCVALALNDESHEPIGAEGILVLDGAQGIAKTSFFRTICPNPKWFGEGVTIDMRNKDDKMLAVSTWITELGEVDSITKKEQPAFKAFVTQTEDRIRYPYDKAATRSPRLTSFCATTNDSKFLRDETGNRRYWIVHIDRIDKKTLFSLPQTSIDQLWAQVYTMYLDDPKGFRLTDEEMMQLQIDNREHEAALPYEEELRALLDCDLDFTEWQWWSAAKLAALDVLPMARDGYNAVKLGRALTRITADLEQQGFLQSGGKSLKRKLNGVWEYLIPYRHGSYTRTHPFELLEKESINSKNALPPS